MTRSRRVRRAALVACTVSILTVGSVATAPAASGVSHEARLLRIINRVRAAHHLWTLRLNAGLSDDAERHTRRMVQVNRIYDPPDLVRLLRPYDWRRVAGSVAGCDGTLNGLVRAWMAHAEHREILLLPGLRYAGIGVVVAEGQSACGRDSYWATGILYG